jgi:hypothetical protein
MKKAMTAVHDATPLGNTLYKSNLGEHCHASLHFHGSREDRLARLAIFSISNVDFIDLRNKFRLQFMHVCL